MRLVLPLVALGLVACADEGSAISQRESCVGVTKEHAAFRQHVQEKAKKLGADLSIEGNDPKVEAYPRLQDSEKFLDFQTEVQTGENKFAVRLKECKE